VWGKVWVDPIVIVSNAQDAMTASVSVISDTPDNGAVAVSMVRGCLQMIAGCRID
jgi:hypothetical protein